MQTIVKRATRTLTKKNVLAIMPVLSQIHSVPNKLYTNNVYNFCYESQNLDRVSSYENLISRISSAESIQEILKIYSVNDQLLKNEHIVLSLRMMARLLKASNNSELDQLHKDERYIQLTDRAAEAIDSLNEYEALDFLFWMRKFRLAKIDIRLNNEAKEKFFQKIGEFLQSKSFNFRNLVNLYYDYTYINRNSHDICTEILKELKSDRKLLTPFTVIQILQASSRRNAFRQTQELVLADYVTRNFHNLLDEFDTDQKCVIFKYLALLEMNYNPPKFKTPPLIYTLRHHLKDKLDQLSETSVINILTAYQYLPREFPLDLIEEIKEMVIVTIQHNSQNIKSFFLLEFIEVIQKIRRRRLDDKQSEVLAKEIQSRLMHDEYLQKSKNIERLIKIYENGLRHDSLVEALTEYAQQDDRKIFFPSILEFLAKKKVDINPFLKTYLSEENVNSLGQYSQIRLYLLLNYLNNSEEYAAQIQKLKEPIEAMAKQESGRLINIIKSSTIFVVQRKELMQLAIQGVQDGFLQENARHNDKTTLIKSLFNSVELREQKNNWIEFFQANSDKFSSEDFSNIIDTFFKQDSYNIDQIQVFLQILQNENPDKLPFRKLQFAVKDGSAFLQEIQKYEHLFRKFFNIMINLCQHQPQNIRLQYIYGFAMRIEGMHYRSQMYLRLLKKSFDHCKALDNYNLNSQVEFMFAILLMENNILQQKHALEIFDKTAEQLDDNILKAKMFSYILQHSNAEFRETRHEQTVEILEELNTNLTTSHTQKVLNSLAVYLSFPSQYVADNKDILLKTTKDYIHQGHHNNLLSIIQAFHPRYVKNHYDLYFNFLKEIINVYPQYRKRLSITNIIDILGKFVSLNCKYPSIYNHILEDIGANFNRLNPENRVKSMDYFSYLQIKQTDFFEKNLEIINNQPMQYRGYLNQILNSLYAIGFDSKESIPHINNIADSIKRDDFLSEIYNYVKLLPILQPENELELFEKWFELMPSERGPIHDRFRSKGEVILLHEFFSKVYPQKPEFAQKLALFMKEDEDFNTNRTNFFQPTNNNTINNATNIGEYLNVMKLEYQTFSEFNGLQVDILIPEKKTMIKIVQARDINFDRSTYNGRTQIFKRIYQALDSEYKVVLINNLEFRKCTDDISRINLLIAEGVESNVQDGQYDFSKVNVKMGQYHGKQNKETQANAQQEQE